MLAIEYIPRYTIEDYKLWKGDWELIDGIAFAMTPSPFGKHQKLAARISQILLNKLDNCEKNETNVYVELDWIVNENTVVRPDVSVLCEDVEEFIITPPKVVFEIVSKSTALKDEKIKFELYEKEKVEYYVLVYPDLEKVRAFRLESNKYEKIFDNYKEYLNLIICGCDTSLDIEKLFR